MKNQSQNNYTPYQLKLPVDLERIIEISDPVYTFCEVMDHIDRVLISNCVNDRIRQESPTTAFVIISIKMSKSRLK